MFGKPPKPPEIFESPRDDPGGKKRTTLPYALLWETIAGYETALNRLSETRQTELDAFAVAVGRVWFDLIRLVRRHSPREADTVRRLQMTADSLKDALSRAGYTVAVFDGRLYRDIDIDAVSIRTHLPDDTIDEPVVAETLTPEIRRGDDIVLTAEIAVRGSIHKKETET
jgi:hypothetical protein